MTNFRSEEFLVGLIALLLIPLIVRRVVRGIREGELPLYRARLSRDAGTARFNLLMALHLLSLLLVSFIAADLLLGLGLRDRL
jgi:hypothetical protein